jgi:cysteinyl-tRNA synthetase
MIERHLGETIDIHAGGVDLQFPHHENEIAQSTCAHEGAPLARYWLHNGFVTVDGAKMSKSLRNVLLIDELRKRFPAEALRYFLLKAHYRQPLDWSEGTIAQVIRTLDGLYGTLRELESLPVSATDTPPESVEAALCDDLNTPRALAALAELGSEARRRATPETKADLLSAGRSLGLLGLVPAQWFAQRQAEAGIDSAAVEALLAQRQEAKRARNFAEADAIRARLSGLGVAIEDTPQGTRWRVAER